MLLQYGFHKLVSTHISFTLLSALLFSPLITLGGQPGLPGIRYSFLLFWRTFCSIFTFSALIFSHFVSLF
nr:MAG TPA: hypothetical protein [Caudoviricetes sp.]